MHPSLRTFPKSWGCYRYLALLCAFGHSPCLTAWRQSPVSRWGGRFGAGWFHLGLFSQPEPSCLYHNAHRGGKGLSPSMQLSHGAAAVARGEHQAVLPMPFLTPSSYPKLTLTRHFISSLERPAAHHPWIPQMGITPKSRPQIARGRENQLRPNSEPLQWDPEPARCHPSHASRLPRPVESMC